MLPPASRSKPASPTPLRPAQVAAPAITNNSVHDHSGHQEMHKVTPQAGPPPPMSPSSRPYYAVPHGAQSSATVNKIHIPKPQRPARPDVKILSFGEQTEESGQYSTPTMLTGGGSGPGWVA